MKISSLILATALGFAVSAPVLADDSAALGEKVYKKCRACHALEPGKMKMSVSLAGLYGATAGKVEGASYSSAMKESEVIWNDETLDAFLADPKGFMPGSRMLVRGLKKAEDRQAIIALMKGL